VHEVKGRNRLPGLPRGEWPTSISELPLILTEAQLAHFQGVSIRTLQRDRRRGASIPFKRLGRKIFYPRDAVLSYFGMRQR
jgi:hypothetical protein